MKYILLLILTLTSLVGFSQSGPTPVPKLPQSLGAKGTKVTVKDQLKVDSVLFAENIRTKNLIADTLFEPDFEFVVLPDLQYQTLRNSSSGFVSDSSIVGNTFNWITNNKTTANIKAVIQVGDLTDDGNNEEFALIDSNYDKLDFYNIPYLYVPGNHDYDLGGPTNSRLTTIYDAWMGPSRYSGHSYYGSNYLGSNANYYIKLDIGRKKFLILGLEFQPRSGAIAWAQSVLDSNIDKETIVVTHGLITIYGEKAQDTSIATNYNLTDNSNGFEIWNNLLRKNKQIIMCINGHYVAPGSGGWQTMTNTNLGPFLEKRVTQTGDNGNIIHMLGFNHQSDSLGGAGHMMRLKFKPSLSKIDVTFFNARYEGTDPRSVNYSLYYPPIRVEGPLGVKDQFNVAGEATFDSTLKLTKLPKYRPVVTGYNGVLDSIAAADSSQVLVSQGPNKPPKYDTLPGNSNAYIKNLLPVPSTLTGMQNGNFWIKGTGVVGGVSGAYSLLGTTPGTFYVSHQSGNFGLVVQRAAGVNTSGANMVFLHSYAANFGVTPVPVNIGAELGTIRWMGIDSTLVGKVGASLRGYVQVKGSNYIGSGLDFRTTISAANQDITRMFLHYDGTLQIMNLGTTGNVLVGSDNSGNLRKVFLNGLSFNGTGDTLSTNPTFLTNTASLDFPDTAPGTTSDLTITVTGAVDGQAVTLGVPNVSTQANSTYSAWVSAANTVTVRFSNIQSAGNIDPTIGTFRATVLNQ